MPYYLETSEGLRLHVRVQPRSSRAQLDGIVGEQLRIRLTAPPVDNAANTACIVFLAEVFGVAKSKVQLVGGQKSRDKVFLISGSCTDLLERLRGQL